jgi:hypothetical protein
MRHARRPELTFPLWMLVHRGSSPWRPVMLTPGSVAAFSTHQRAAAFAARRWEPGWEFRLVVRPAFLRMADELRRLGAAGVHLDPDTDGGVVIDLPGTGVGTTDSGSAVLRIRGMVAIPVRAGGSPRLGSDDVTKLARAGRG